MSNFAPKNADGLSPYVLTRSEWGRRTASIVWAKNLAAAKAKHGWTREQYVSLSLRRARVEDMPRAEA